jgi:hypothetical protein
VTAARPFISTWRGNHDLKLPSKYYKLEAIESLVLPYAKGAKTSAGGKWFSGTRMRLKQK